jgi:6-phosphogluconolactonase
MSDREPDTARTYGIEGHVEAPPLPGTVVVRPDNEELHHALGSDLLLHAKNCVRAFGDFHLALSGGSTPLPFYERLMTDPTFRELPWEQTHLWIVDERRVPLDDAKSNFRHIAELIVDHSDVPRTNVHPMAATDDDADIAYERVMREVLGWREKGHDRLDFVLLGMGGDGHTASLFPHSPALRERERLIVINDGDAVTPPPRITMTYPLINGARFIAVLVTGEGKRNMLARIAARDGSSTELPILGIEPVGGDLRWYIDHAAAGVA